MFGAPLTIVTPSTRNDRTPNIIVYIYRIQTVLRRNHIPRAIVIKIYRTPFHGVRVRNIHRVINARPRVLIFRVPPGCCPVERPFAIITTRETCQTYILPARDYYANVVLFIVHFRFFFSSLYTSKRKLSRLINDRARRIAW